jgi:hypothetical protein
MSGYSTPPQSPRQDSEERKCPGAPGRPTKIKRLFEYVCGSDDDEPNPRFQRKANDLKEFMEAAGPLAFKHGVLSGLGGMCAPDKKRMLDCGGAQAFTLKHLLAYIPGFHDDCSIKDPTGDPKKLKKLEEDLKAILSVFLECHPDNWSFMAWFYCRVLDSMFGQTASLSEMLSPNKLDPYSDPKAERYIIENQSARNLIAVLNPRYAGAAKEDVSQMLLHGNVLSGDTKKHPKYLLARE